MKPLHALCIAGMITGTGGHASSISDLDLSELVFDIQTETPTEPSFALFTGVSGLSGATVGFSVIAFEPLTDTTSGQPFAFPPATGLGSPTFENVHVGAGTVIEFDDPISRLLIYAQNDVFALFTGIDLGFAPSDFGGATGASGATGYTVSAANSASFFLYDFATPTTSVVNVFSGAANDGFDMAFFAEPAPTTATIPVPAGLPLALTGLGALALLRRKA